MTTKTIPAYLEDERHKSRASQLRMEEEASRIQLLHDGQDRTSKHPRLEVLADKAVPKARKTVAASRKKSGTPRKTATKARKVA